VLVLCTQDAKVGGGGLGVLQGIGGLDHGDLVCDAGVILGFGIGERLAVGIDGVVVKLLQGILAA